jgi:chromosome partitioning protein
VSAIALINQKGGVGKSSTSLHLAVWLAKKRKSKVLLVDADAQRSSSKWLEKMDVDIPVKVMATANEILDGLPDLNKQFDYIILDGPAGLAETTRAVLLRCDLAICPVQPSELDLSSAEDAAYLIKQAQSVRGGLPRAALFLSRAVKGTRLKGEAIAVLEKSGIHTLTTVIHQRQVVADAPGQQATVWEMTGKPAVEAGAEYEKLFKEILGLLK